MKIAKADLVPTEANLLEAYETFGDFRAACDAFCQTVNERDHRETRRPPVELLAEERRGRHDGQHLQPLLGLPELPEFEHDLHGQLVQLQLKLDETMIASIGNRVGTSHRRIAFVAGGVLVLVVAFAGAVSALQGRGVAIPNLAPQGPVAPAAAASPEPTPSATPGSSQDEGGPPPGTSTCYVADPQHNNCGIPTDVWTQRLQLKPGTTLPPAP